MTTVIAANPVTLIPRPESPKFPLPVTSMPQEPILYSQPLEIPIAENTPSPPLPSPSSIFGSYPSAFVPYVSQTSVESPSSSFSSPTHTVSNNPLTSMQSSPEKSVHSPPQAMESVLSLEFIPQPEEIPKLDNESFQPSENSQPTYTSILDNPSFFIPVPSNITAPVQMFTTPKSIPGVARLVPANNNDEPVSALSQYFSNTNQNQVTSS